MFNKPAGTSFHSETGTGFFAALTAAHPENTFFPAHRLDKITSGLLLVARSKDAAREFSEMFESRAIKKTYIALSNRKPAKKQGTVTGDMERTRNGSWKLLHTRNNPAITRFTSCALAPNLRAFILHPATGRTHQLRVMMKSLGSPILGDERYGGSAADRGYLHAARLQFVWREQNIDISNLPIQGEYFLPWLGKLNEMMTFPDDQTS